MGLRYTISLLGSCCDRYRRFVYQVKDDTALSRLFYLCCVYHIAFCNNIGSAQGNTHSGSATQSSGG